MELPFLKNKNKYAGGGGPMEREPDSSSPDQMIEMVADELMSAMEKKDRAALIDALRAFVTLIQNEDQDEEMPS